MFDLEIWKAYYYMYINPSLNCNKLEDAFNHYMTSGRHNGNLLFGLEVLRTTKRITIS